MARKWKGTRKQRAALRKMLAARRRSLRGTTRKTRRGRRRTSAARSRPRRRAYRFTKARRLALRKARHARLRRRSTAIGPVFTNPKHRRRRGRRRARRRLLGNPMGTNWPKKTTRRMARSRRNRRGGKGYRGMGTGYKRRARPAKGGAVARKTRRSKKSRKGRRKGYRFTAARRRALAKAQRASRRARRGGKSRRKARRSKSRRKGRKSRRRVSRRRYSARTMRTIRTRRRGRGRSRRKGLSTLRRARRYLKGRRRVGSLARRYARRWGMQSNPSIGGGLALLKKAGFALGGLMATRYLPNLLTLIPGAGAALGAAGTFAPLAASIASGLALWWISGRGFVPGIVRAHRNEILIGAGLGVLEQAIARFLPAMTSPGLSDTWVESTQPLADYVADGADLGGYVPELGGLGLNVEQALAGYVVEGPISQAVAGLGSSAATAMARARGDAWTAAGPIPPRPMSLLGAGYGGIFNKGPF